MLEALEIPVLIEKPAARDLRTRLEPISAQLKAIDEPEARVTFEVPGDAILLKSTISLCDACLEHVPGAIYSYRGRVLLNKRCPTHGLRTALIESDAGYYRLSNKDRWGRQYTDATRVEIPPFASCCSGSSCNRPPRASVSRADSTNQDDNKTCTVLVEVTDACNLACPVCYADSRGDRMLPIATFKAHILRLIAAKGSLDSVQITGGEATLHPDFWEMIDWLYGLEAVGKIYLPTNGVELSKGDVASRLKPYRSKALVLLQFDGAAASTNRALRGANTRRIRERLIRKLDRAGIPMQLTMTLASGVSEDEIAWVVRQGIKHKNVRLIGMLPAFYSGRYELDKSPCERLTLSDVVKGAAAGTNGRATATDFMPIPCSHPNCGWATLFARRFGLFFNIARHVDLNAVMDDVAYKTVLKKHEMRALVGSRYHGGWRKLLSALGRRLIRPQDVFGVAIKPFMDAYNYDQDRVSSCCHHTLDTDGALVSFCEYNARLRHRDSWVRLPSLQRR